MFIRGPDNDESILLPIRDRCRISFLTAAAAKGPGTIIKVRRYRNELLQIPTRKNRGKIRFN
jgi:hypothetical protein